MQKKGPVLTIRDPRARELASRLSRQTGKSITDVVLGALEAQVKETPKPIDWEGIRRLQERVARMPVYDQRPADQILGYDELGLPRG